MWLYAAAQLNNEQYDWAAASQTHNLLFWSKWVCLWHSHEHMPSFCYSGFKISVGHFCAWYFFVDILTIDRWTTVQHSCLLTGWYWSLANRCLIMSTLENNCHLPRGESIPYLVDWLSLVTQTWTSTSIHL